MKNPSLDEYIALIKNGKKIEARQLLQNILRSDLHNLKGWYWYVETFDTPEQKMKALRSCLKYNPDNQEVKDLIRTFETKYPQLGKSASSDNKSAPKKVQPPTSKKPNKNLLILGGILGVGIVGVICVLAIGISLSNQLHETVSIPEPTIAFTQTSTPMPFTGKWQVFTSKSEFDSSTTVTLSLDAEEYVKGWLSTTLPTLVLRCKEGRIQAYVKTGLQADVEYGHESTVSIRVRFDQNEAAEMRATESTDGDELFFQDPFSTIMTMLQSNEMVFGFTPFNADPAVTNFDLRGLANVIEPLKQNCNWNGAYPTLPPLPTLMPTSTSLPPGSALTISGKYSDYKWRVEIDEIKVTKSVSSYGNTTKAGGQFLLLFLKVTNLGNDPYNFGIYDVRVKDAEGNLYDMDFVAANHAEDTYGVVKQGLIQPGDTTIKVFAFDVPPNSAFYFLVPGSLADDNGESIVLEIPQ
ncbi:hypothetical protein CO110_04115 [Candidatus Desantisbacteria bacterium CG_4_9_14_3_um_filter_40_11]|uniref:DUF4352 domain-containing protein n=1 Tax=Candidatus Desantisbacteria bacterium CG_4_9_14_3_um_filter_40_11 TaxID=1974546 RepID=A0A2M8AUD0_9BACT|nr:MAG: hypothetical protein CO110_04115 [Candidatus Desantisbacteria bacterium CG_4_9_14_3_um_filter_40_11]